MSIEPTAIVSTAADERVVTDHDVVSDDDRRTVLRFGRGAAMEYPPGDTLATLFEQQVDRTPARIAVADEFDSITYGELNRRANRLARHLRQHGVAPGTVVGVFAERSVDLVVALLGALKAGGAYAPLDTSYPSGRLALMLEDARIDLVVVADAASRRGLPGNVQTIVSLADDRPAIAACDDTNLSAAALEDSPAYVIFTSGSTGRPKGVLVAHRSIVNHMMWMQHDFPLDERHRVLQRSPFSFDASVWEFWAPLLVGARLFLARPGLHHDTAYLKRTIVQHGITTMQIVPSLLRLMLEEDRLDECESLERMFCGGEPLTLDVQDAFFSQSRAELHNLYGPTEGTVVVTTWCCERGGRRRIVPIGRPIANADIYILDEALQPVGVNVPGELYIAGRAVARGYIGRRGATAERFLPDPLTSERGARMYRSGDLARWLPDGTIEFLGRVDQQVKIHGLRIELGEIEEALATHPGVRGVAAAARRDAPDRQRLAAYVVLRPDSPPSIPELAAHLRQRLPEYMVPSSIVVIPALPLSPSGKVDYRALPDPSVVRSASTAPPTPSSAGTPATELDGVVAEIWKTVLRVEQVGLHDNFFDIGGHSLLVLQVHARLRKRLAREIEITNLFRYTTVRTLAQYLERTEP